VLNVVPQLVMPLLVINALGAARGAIFFLSTQIVTMQCAAVLAVGNSMYAESQRTQHRYLHVVRRGGMTMAVVAVTGVALVVVTAPFLLALFGPHYAEQGSLTLRVLSLCALAFAFNHWSAMRLRIADHLHAMVGVQLISTVLIVVLAGLAAPYGTVGIALAWGAGQLVGGIVGYVVSRTVALPLAEKLVREERPGLVDEVL